MRSRRLSEIRREVVEVLRGLARELNATVYLFGSYARGDHTVESDVDIVVVSEVFEGMGYVDRVEMVRTRLPPHIGFDIIPLTPSELERRASRSFFREISRYWVRIEPSG